jgi:hypothetical protein
MPVRSAIMKGAGEQSRIYPETAGDFCTRFSRKILSEEHRVRLNEKAMMKIMP